MTDNGSTMRPPGMEKLAGGCILPALFTWFLIAALAIALYQTLK